MKIMVMAKANRNALPLDVVARKRALRIRMPAAPP
jgi:hypothetical protein